jgi:LysE type translocator
MSLSFLLTSLIVVVSPGTGVLYTLAVALTKGSRASVAAAFGCTLGIIPHMSAAMLGLAAVLHTSALAFAALKYCGVIYLLYMAWQALRETGALAVEARPDARSGRRVIATGFLINILNPKLSIFFLAFLAAVHRRRRRPPPDADAGTELRVHGDDACGIRGLRPVRLGRPRPHRDAAESHDLAAPRLRRRFCRARRKTGVRRAVIPDRHAPA